MSCHPRAGTILDREAGKGPRGTTGETGSFTEEPTKVLGDSFGGWAIQRRSDVGERASGWYYVQQ